MTDIIGIALLFAVSAFLLKGFAWKGAPVFCALCAVFLLSRVSESLGKIFASVTDISESLEIGETVRCALKILGMGYLYGIAADSIRELGEEGIAKSLEMAGRVEIIIVILPFFEEILKVGTELLL